MEKIQATLAIKADKDRQVEFMATKEVVDRDGEILKVNGIDIKNYKKNPVVLWAHNRGEPPIGKATQVTKSRNGELKIKVQFAEADEYGFADTIYKLVKGGYISAVSIGFIPDFNAITSDEKTGARVFNKTELLELSVVPVPANQEALSLGKALEDGVIDEVELNEWRIFCDKAVEDEGTELAKAIQKKVEEISKSYLDSLFENYKKDASAEAKEGQTDEFTEEDMKEILNEMGFDDVDVADLLEED